MEFCLSTLPGRIHLQLLGAAKLKAVSIKGIFLDCSFDYGLAITSKGNSYIETV